MLVAGIVCLVVYPIGQKLNRQIQDELAERRSRYASEAAASASSRA
jgi:hypothetical protein